MKKIALIAALALTVSLVACAPAHRSGKSYGEMPPKVTYRERATQDREQLKEVLSNS